MDENDRVFRISGIPAELPQAALGSVLDAVFAAESGSGIKTTVRSLGPHPQRGTHMVATVTFSSVPQKLSKGASWQLSETVEHNNQSIRLDLEIDVGFLGFTPTNTPIGDESDRIDCIAVSGLSSHPFGSWKKRGGRFMWLVDDDAAVPSNVRMLLYGYDTSLVASQSFQNVTDIGKSLAAAVQGIRPSAEGAFEPRPIVFIAHSLGGLVVKEAICHMVKTDPRVARCVYGLIFFGVPHNGLLVDPWLRIVENRPNEQLITALKPHSQYLQRLAQEFGQAFALGKSRVISIYETMTSRSTKEESPGVFKRTGDYEVLVTPGSALGDWAHPVIHNDVAINRSHEDLPKFNGKFDPDYLVLRPYLQKIWANAVADIQLRFETAPSQAEAETAEAFRGLVQLWPAEEAGRSSGELRTEFDIIAIHGLGGHAVETWKAGEKVWLRDMLPWNFEKARVFSFGYDSAYAFLQTSLKAHDTAILLLESIRRLQRQGGGRDRRRTIFVCHCLGGILFKQAANIAYEPQSRYHSLSESITGVIFLGSPHISHRVRDGAGPRAQWANILDKLAMAAAGRTSQPDGRVTDYDSLKTICSLFDERGMLLKIFSFYELRPIPSTGSLVVDQPFAILHLPHEATIPLDGDHESISKYLTSSSRSYLTVCSSIEELLEAPMPGGEVRSEVYHNNEQSTFLSTLGLSSLRIGKGPHSGPMHWGSTAQWFHEHPHFISWTSLRGIQTLWLHGQPGSGKSVLMRSACVLLNHQRESMSGPIVRLPIQFFFDDKDPTRNSPGHFVRSVLYQILSDRDAASLIDYLDTSELQRYVEDEERLWQCLSTIVKRSHGFMFQFIVDAVDEGLRSGAGASITVIDRLQSLLSLDSSGRVKLLVSSRTEAPYSLSAATDIKSISTSNEATRRNVEGFIRAQVRTSLQRSYKAIRAGQDVEDKLIALSRGNFLFAQLAWEQFSRGLTRWSQAEIQQGFSRLESVSPDLADAYCRLLKTVPPAYVDRARTSFAILRVSKEKLTPRQLAFMATLHSQASNASPSTLSELRRQAADLETYLSEICGFLVKETEDGMVDFIHVSAKDLFLADPASLASSEARTVFSKFRVVDSDAHALLHTLCIKILRLENATRTPAQWHALWDAVLEKEKNMRRSFGEGKLLTPAEMHHIMAAVSSHINASSRTHCLLYSVCHWFSHYAAATKTYELDQNVATFAQTVPGYYSHLLWTRLQVNAIAPLNRYQESHTTPGYTAEHAIFRVVAQGDCPEAVKAFLANGINAGFIPYKKGGITILSWAILCQRKQVFQVLLRNEEVQINYGSVDESKPLHHAAACEDTFYLEALVRRPEINVNVEKRPSTLRDDSFEQLGSPLHAAIWARNVSAVQILLSQPYIDIWATQGGWPNRTAYSRLFLDNIWEPVIPALLKIASETPTPSAHHISRQLSVAGMYGWTRVEEAILWADPLQVLAVDSTTGFNTVEHCAYFGRKEKLMWYLNRLPYGFPLRSSSGSRYDILHLCANQDWEDVVLHLQRRHNLATLRSDHVGRTLLHWALEYSWNLDAINLSEYTTSGLLNTQDRDGLTALHIAVMNRNMEAMDLLMASGADCFVKDKKGMSPAHIAADIGYRKALQLFTRSERREFGRTRSGASLLHLMAMWFEGPLVRNFVLTKRALVNVVDKHRRTPLHYAAMSNNLSAVEQLVELGALVDTRDENGRTALHEAIRGSAAATASLLLDLGANPKATDSVGQNCLHLSVRYGADRLVRRLLQLGVDINAVDAFGMRPIHRACATGDVQRIWSLVEEGADWGAHGPRHPSPLDSAVESRSVDAVGYVLELMEHPRRYHLPKRTVATRALQVAGVHDFMAVEGMLIKAGAIPPPGGIKVKRLYMEGPRPESRWPLWCPD